MHRTTWILTAAVAALVATLAACDGDPEAAAASSAGTDVAAAAEAFDVTVASPAADNLTGAATTAIAATVFVPAHRAGERYPLILHSHGWGGNRITLSDAETNNQNADTSTLYSRVVDLEVKRFWDAGYAVISFDERGIGQSGGMVRVMDPDYETRDAMALIDWGVANLELVLDADGDPRVGTIGGSYGGGFQLLLAARDPRVDAITPSVTWYDLNEALQEGGVLAKGWLAGLCLVAKTDQRKMDPTVQSACEEAADAPATRLSEDLVLSGPGITGYFGEHSLAAFEKRHDGAVDGYRMQPVDALFVQGMRDTLFSVNHAYHGYRFLSRLGGDVRLLTHQHGHILPAPFSTNAALGSIACGGVDTIEAIRAWMDAKLRGNAQALARIPEVCLSLDDDEGAALDRVPVGGSAVVSIPATGVTAADSDLGGAGGGPVFVPLAAPIPTDDFVLAGIPTASLKVTATVPGTVAVAFVAVGVKRGDAAPYPVDHQVRALRSDREHADIELRGVGERLHSGDQVGVLVYGDFSEFEPEGQPANFMSNAFTIEGEVRLPIVARPGI